MTVKLRFFQNQQTNWTRWHLSFVQGCCLMGARSPEAPKLWVRATKVLFKEPVWTPKHGVLEIHSQVICLMTSIFSRNPSKNHSHNKLNRKQQLLWSCFTFIMRNMGQTTATKSLSVHKTAENNHIWKSPYNALQAQYWINIHHVHVCQWIASLLMP